MNPLHVHKSNYELSRALQSTSEQSGFTIQDANGNAVSFIDEAGNSQAHYTYDAFGNTVSQTGVMAADFRFRFSSKYLDHETGLYFYGYRWYSPTLGRWMSRDLIGEWGGLLLYGLVGNDAINYMDILGLIFKTDADEDLTKVLKVEVPDPNDSSKTVFVNASGVTEMDKVTLPPENSKDSNCDIGYRGRTDTLYIHVQVTYMILKTSPGYKNTVEHEDVHVADIKAYHDAVEATLLGGECLCIPCYNAKVAYQADEINRAFLELMYKSAKFDCDQYKNVKSCRLKSLYWASQIKAEVRSMVSRGTMQIECK